MERSTVRKMVTKPIAILGIGLAGLMAANAVDINMPDIPGLNGLFEGGESDPTPRGDVIYQGQEAKTAVERFMIEIGGGEATVAVKAKQNHDKDGGLLDGDFQSTNGTSSVADPDDRDRPADLVVSMRYCADGMIETKTETITQTDPETNEAQEFVKKTVVFDMGRITVCDATLEHTPDNDAAFKQDDTPDRFHGDFVSFVAGATEAAAVAAPCPTDELENYTSPLFGSYVRQTLANQLDIPETDVVVEAGTIGTTDRATQAELKADLESYANKRDPDNPDKEYEALSIQYMDLDGEAVANSCYTNLGSVELSTLQDLNSSTTNNNDESPVAADRSE